MASPGISASSIENGARRHGSARVAGAVAGSHMPRPSQWMFESFGYAASDLAAQAISESSFRLVLPDFRQVKRSLWNQVHGLRQFLLGASLMIAAAQV
jgi:hypothetical protein